MKKALLLVLIMFYNFPLHAGFLPWNTDVRGGDELYSRVDNNTMNPHVLNGAQGGAFFLIKFFQVCISPQDGPNCRHTPTCSAYAKKAVMKYGAFIGSILAGERLLRCNPFYPPERDPVPDRIPSR